ncbi:MAG: putative transport system permease protein [Conexibacter sp.]|nr:putative transport system permease protein [Conexibacter sp.]
MSSHARRTRPRRSLRESFAEAGEGVIFSSDVTRGLFRPGMRRYFGEALRQAGILISGSVLVVFGMCFALGLVIGIQGSYGAAVVGAPAAAGAFAAIGNLREVAPYAFGYMMAAKVSTGFVAELGTMRISDEIDALDVMGFDSKLYLCSTRLMGCWMVLPGVYAISLVTAYLGSYISAVLQVAQVSSGGYFELFWKFQSPADYAFSISKAMAMGTFVVLVGCYYGFKVRGGPVEIGRATARAMVINLLGVHVIGILGSQLFWGGVPRLPIGG